MSVDLYQGDSLTVLKTLPERSVQCCVTSPPYYGLRDYGTAKWEGGDEACDHKTGRFTTPHSEKQGSNAGSGDVQARETCPHCGAVRVDAQIGLEETPEAYVEKLVAVFREVKRVMKDDGTLWLNIGDSYNSSPSNQQSGDVHRHCHDNNGTNRMKRDIPGLKPKDLIGIPWMVAFALRADGWWLRSDIIWAKPSCMPESVTDRPTKSHEYMFLLAKSQKYYYDHVAILEPANYDGRKDTKFKGSVKMDLGAEINTMSRVGGERWPNKIRGFSTNDQIDDNQHHGKNIGYSRMGTNIVGHSGNENADGQPARNKRDVWTVNPKPYKEAHFAVFPPALIEPCILAGSRPGDTVLDPFNGSGTTGEVSLTHHRNYIGIELNPKYILLTKKRLAQVQPRLTTEA